MTNNLTDIVFDDNFYLDPHRLVLQSYNKCDFVFLLNSSM